MRDVAVVVPAYRETDGLALLLDSIARLEDPPRVVVAVDGGWGPTVEVASGRPGVEVLALQENRGSYAARNAALERIFEDGTPRAVLFTDADCVVTAGWVERHLAVLESTDLSGGGVRFTFRRDKPSVAEWVDAGRHLKQEAYVRYDGFAATCNLAVRGEVLEKHRFDDRLRTGGDAEFCRRVTAAGATLAYTGDALIEHPARDLRELWVKVGRISGGVGGQVERWKERPLPSRRLTRSVWWRAQQAGYRVGPVWGVSACLVDWAMTMRLRRAVKRLGIHG